MNQTYHKSTKNQYPEFLVPRSNAEFRAARLNTAIPENEASAALGEVALRSTGLRRGVNTASRPERKPLSARSLKARVDLAGIVGRFTKLRRSGYQLVGLCPLHEERHPSFYVHPEKQIFHCFGCGAGGDVFDFVMRATGCDFFCALQIVAEFSERVARDSEPQSGSRVGAGEGAQPLSAAKRRSPHSPFGMDSRARIVAALDSADRRLARIAATNAEGLAALATPCEPDRGGSAFTCQEAG